MAKAKFERNKPHVNVGTIGHVDHGKTTLTAAIATICAKLTAVKRKITHKSTQHLKKKHVVLQLIHHVEYDSPTRHYAHVDCPGHADYVKT